MTKKLKTIVLAFSGLIVYSALITTLTYLISDPIYAKLVARISVILLGGAYLKTVLNEHKVYNPPSSKLIGAMIAAILTFVAASFVTTNFILISTQTDAAYSQTSLASDNIFLSVIMSVFLAPIAEEIIFRGFMYKQLAKFNVFVAMFVSSLVFALWHGTLVHMYAATLGGMLFCLIYLKTSKLRYCIAAHILFNGLTLLLGLIVPLYAINLISVIVLNALLLAAFVNLLKQECASSAAKPKSVLTDEEKRRREEISRIVSEVMDEKSQH